jgi:hypothetical protein
MKLKKFIEKLKEVSEKHGENLEVVMADGIPVVTPIFLKTDQEVVITDEK